MAAEAEEEADKEITRTLVRVLVPIAAVLTVMGSMAVAGALPHTVQKAVSHAAGTVGLNLPGDDESTDVPGQGDQGENADDQGDNNNQGEDTQSGDTQSGGGSQDSQGGNSQGD